MNWKNIVERVLASLLLGAILLIVLYLLSGCTPKQNCDISNGAKAFWGIPTETCK
jgi:hypothetical protein